MVGCSGLAQRRSGKLFAICTFSSPGVVSANSQDKGLYPVRGLHATFATQASKTKQ